jgi:hypothetical protein
MHIKLQKNGVTKEVKVGFSWTVFCFGWLALAARGMIVPALITLGTLGLAGLYYCFTINRIQARHMVVDGWVIDDADKELAADKWGIK